MPGGGDAVNSSYYTVPGDLLDRLKAIQPGMSESAVYAALGHDKDDLVRLPRDQVVTALYGSTFLSFRDDEAEHEGGSSFLQSLYGYRLYYKVVSREHGFSSPIRVRTDETGFDYAVTLIFRDRALYEKPIVTGGIVNKSSSRTLFDYFSPGMVLDRTIP